VAGRMLFWVLDLVGDIYSTSGCYEVHLFKAEGRRQKAEVKSYCTS